MQRSKERRHVDRDIKTPLILCVVFCIGNIFFQDTVGKLFAERVQAGFPTPKAFTDAPFDVLAHAFTLRLRVGHIRSQPFMKSEW